jgi:hypothetical protein
VRCARWGAALADLRQQVRLTIHRKYFRAA